MMASREVDRVPTALLVAAAALALGGCAAPAGQGASADPSRAGAASRSPQRRSTAGSSRAIRTRFSRRWRRSPVEGGIDAPQELQDAPVADARWIVLRETGDEVLVGLGAWGPVGPLDDAAEIVTFARTPDGLQALGWGGCSLAPVPPEPWTFWAHLGAPDAAA
ncbi:hypothetical protein [Miniimonas sp. S16]|uniref:hypothetical protein n=1 Tax=Miniimonas sp. S16 TaxID=2171623 RepID=UPI000D5283A4|nr:hypothetical protein [Miniimonas sp. S16]